MLRLPVGAMRWGTGLLMQLCGQAPGFSSQYSGGLGWAVHPGSVRCWAPTYILDIRCPSGRPIDTGSPAPLHPSQRRPGGKAAGRMAPQGKFSASPSPPLPVIPPSPLQTPAHSQRPPQPVQAFRTQPPRPVHWPGFFAFFH